MTGVAPLSPRSTRDGHDQRHEAELMKKSRSDVTLAVTSSAKRKADSPYDGDQRADFAAGNYRFLPYAFQYSSGVAAQPGYEIERVQFRNPVPLMEGFERVEAHIRGRGRPLTSFCACELRSPGQFTDQGFFDFNKQLRRHAGEVGRVRRQDQSGGALQRLSGDRRAGRAVAFTHSRSPFRRRARRRAS